MDSGQEVKNIDSIESHSGSVIDFLGDFIKSKPEPNQVGTAVLNNEKGTHIKTIQRVASKKS